MAYLLAFGAYLPSRVVDNQELAAAAGTDAEWILRATGIVERRFAAPDESVASLGIRAAKDCLENAGLTARDVGLLLVASSSAEHRFPGPASAIGAGLGINGVPAVDLPIAKAAEEAHFRRGGIIRFIVPLATRQLALHIHPTPDARRRADK